MFDIVWCTKDFIQTIIQNQNFSIILRISIHNNFYIYQTKLLIIQNQKIKWIEERSFFIREQEIVKSNFNRWIRCE